MTLKQRIWSLPLITVAVFALGIGVSIAFALAALDHIEHAKSDSYPRVDLVKRLKAEFEGIGEDLRSAVSEGEKARLNAAAERGARAATLVEQLRALAGAAAQADALGRGFREYTVAATAAAQLMMGSGSGDPQAAVARMQDSHKALSQLIDTSIAQADADFAASLAGGSARVQHLLISVVAAAVLVVALLVGMAWLITRAVFKELGGEPADARRVATALAAGDFSQPLPALAAGDRSSLLHELATMQKQLAGVIGGIRRSTESINTASGEIAQGNADLSSRTEQQASNLQQTAASMEQMTS
ncbi:MAG: hypothetical protein MUC68_14900, partial [Burkholderiaceae bacterium]|nr:hypothetical protein [Burkholderiaceae bacterium]